jgi:hypothetical protein
MLSAIATRSLENCRKIKQGSEFGARKINFLQEMSTA